MDMANALVKNDFARFSKYLPPAIIEYAGGSDKLKMNMDSASRAMKQFAISFKRILIGNPGPIINYKDQLQCVVPQTSTMETPLAELEVTSSLIAISTDQGKNWYFIDTNVYKADKVKKVLPGLSPELRVPTQQAPKITPNSQQ
jgi:hypothetical protein